MATFAVIDLETTGLNPYRNDRVVELAVVIFQTGKGIIEEFTTLVNPERDVGPTRIHGITASDIIHAPRFIDLAGNLVEILKKSHALVGHNIRFDHSFLQSEYSRIRYKLPDCALIDTMRLAGGGALSACCSRYGVQFDGRLHTALHDARATTWLLQTIILKCPDAISGYGTHLNNNNWPEIAINYVQLLPRHTLQKTQYETPRYIQRLAERLSSDSGNCCPEGERDYRLLLNQVLEDRQIEDIEAESLVDLATHCGLGLKQIEAIHQDYLAQLVKLAWVDNYLSDSERNELQLVSQLLGMGRLTEEKLDNLLQLTAQEIAVTNENSNSWIGKTVCFTGECGCTIGRRLISRDLAEQLAKEKGIIIKDSVTKSLDILVVADPNTQSGKAKKARQYGTRIIHEPVFWRALGIAID